jgi:hypothetical protein
MPSEAVFAVDGSAVVECRVESRGGGGREGRGVHEWCSSNQSSSHTDEYSPQSSRLTHTHAHPLLPLLHHHPPNASNVGG